MLKSPDVPGVLPPIASVMIAVVFDRDFRFFPTHIEMGDYVTAFVADKDLCLRTRQARLNQQ